MNVLLIKGYDLIKEVKPALRFDDEHHFIACLEHCLLIEKSLQLLHQSMFTLDELLALICTHRAGKCARALVRGQAGIGVDVDRLNRPLIDFGMPPLHLAAQNLSLGVTEAFLLAGADPNLCFFPSDSNGDNDEDNDHHDDIANLPLSLALEALSCNPCVAEWSVEKSVVKLIYILCVNELKEPLDTIRILASRTQQVEKLALQYAGKGQVVQLTVLLLTAWNKLVTPTAQQQLQQGSVDCCSIGQCVVKKLEALSLSSSNQQSNAQCPSDLVKLQSAWNMLKLLESNYYFIDRYLVHRPYKEVENHEVPYAVAAYTSIGCREDVHWDDIQCLMPRLEPKQKARLNRALQTYSGPPAVYSWKSRKGFAATTLMSKLKSKSFHSCSNSNLFTNDKGSTKVEKPAIRQLLPTARTCAYLVSLAKRRLK